LLIAGAFLAAVGNPGHAATRRGPTLPEIRLSKNQAVPACVTPGRLNRHLMEHTRDLDPRFRDIARYYKQHGEALLIRWDYAFYQMLLETNYLSYKTGSGRPGDVDPRQNNFAGIGTAGGGVPGDAFPDVSSGVLAQMQHLVAYSGEHVAKPLATRTREKQDDIIEQSQALKRPVRFSDLTNRWAKDSSYGKSIEWVAERYRQANCTATGEPLKPSQEDIDERSPARPQSASASVNVASTTAPGTARAASAAAPHAPPCDVYSASYGGPVALLIRSIAGTSVNYTILQVEPELERPQAEAFIRTHAPNGRTIARFPSPEPAFVRAFELCPGRS
jgi:hypothetical protein